MSAAVKWSAENGLADSRTCRRRREQGATLWSELWSAGHCCRVEATLGARQNPLQSFEHLHRGTGCSGR